MKRETFEISSRGHGKGGFCGKGVVEAKEEVVINKAQMRKGITKSHFTVTFVVN